MAEVSSSDGEGLRAALSLGCPVVLRGCSDGWCVPVTVEAHRGAPRHRPLFLSLSLSLAPPSLVLGLNPMLAVVCARRAARGWDVAGVARALRGVACTARLHPRSPLSARADPADERSCALRRVSLRAFCEWVDGPAATHTDLHSPVVPAAAAATADAAAAAAAAAAAVNAPVAIDDAGDDGAASLAAFDATKWWGYAVRDALVHALNGRHSTYANRNASRDHRYVDYQRLIELCDAPTLAAVAGAFDWAPLVRAAVRGAGEGGGAAAFFDHCSVASQRAQVAAGVAVLREGEGTGAGLSTLWVGSAGAHTPAHYDTYVRDTHAAFQCAPPHSTYAHRDASCDRTHTVCISRMGAPFDVCISRMDAPFDSRISRMQVRSEPRGTAVGQQALDAVSADGGGRRCAAPAPRPV